MLDFEGAAFMDARLTFLYMVHVTFALDDNFNDLRAPQSQVEACSN